MEEWGLRTTKRDLKGLSMGSIPSFPAKSQAGKDSGCKGFGCYEGCIGVLSLGLVEEFLCV